MLGKKRLNLSTQYALDKKSKDKIPPRTSLRHWVLAAIANEEITQLEITLRFVNREEARQFNQQYRQKDYATNILSFPYDDVPILRGDLLICVDVVAEEATTQRKNPVAHYAHLIVHGMLHLQGYDHEGNHQAEEMETMEREILHKLGFPDPYDSSALTEC